MSVFKAYDIRGIYGREFTREDVYRIGYFLPGLLKANTVLVGRDVRASSEEVFLALCKGITDAGADVVSAGLATTPMVYFLTAARGFEASVQITASHNPPEYNGLKISRSGALPVGYETGLAELEALTKKGEIQPVAKKGTVREENLLEDYLAFLNARVPDTGTMRIGIDCSNGMACLLIKHVLGDAPDYIFDTLDGTFPGHEPNPLDPRNVQDLIALVRNKQLDLGVIFDGDADRVMFVDETGTFIRPDLLIAVLGRHYLSQAPGPVLVDIRTSRSVVEDLKQQGGQPHMWKVGHAFAKLKMRELNAAFGGELAGHYYFREFYNCDSGLLAALLILKVFADCHRAGHTVSQVIAEINRHANSGEVNFKIEQKQAAMETLRNVFCAERQPSALYDFDGYRIEYPDWWFNVRPSNTEPYLRLIVEADTDTLLQEKLSAIRAALAPYLGSAP